ncbi:hypothetical protein GF327_08955 [Candidatus Woesearchaeota archaeon]|nr:hypothetical protein [Candidatus Woesearchaeota archaeon]
MKTSLIKGATFGLTSGIITTLGLIVGLNSGTHSKTVVLGGILTIAIADSLSDALGVHVSEESENRHTNKEIWTSTIATLISKFLFALTFILPVVLFKLDTAIKISIAWGLFFLSFLSFLIARHSDKKPFNVIAEHISIATAVIIITNYTGKIVSLLVP